MCLFISSSQIRTAMKVLNEISELIQNNGSSGQFVEASNRFYTVTRNSILWLEIVFFIYMYLYR